MKTKEGRPALCAICLFSRRKKVNGGPELPKLG
jgi:hypothetical protein